VTFVQDGHLSTRSWLSPNTRANVTLTWSPQLRHSLGATVPLLSVWVGNEVIRTDPVYSEDGDCYNRPTSSVGNDRTPWGDGFGIHSGRIGAGDRLESVSEPDETDSIEHPSPTDPNDYE
jgi:hypothetical protein